MTEAEIETRAVGPLVQLRILPSRLIWRIGPAWAVLSGALAAGAPLLSANALFRIAAAIILADLLWGALRHLVPIGQGHASQAAVPALLPYAQPGAPLSRLLVGLSGGASGARRATWPALLLGLALTGAVSALLGPVALLLSASVLVALAFVWAWARRSGGADFGEALLDVALPWLLGASLAGTNGLSWQVLAVAAAFTLLHWGALRRREILAWIGQGAVLAALIAARQPWGLAAAAVLFAPPAWWLVARRPGALARVLPWWWAAMLIAALAIA